MNANLDFKKKVHTIFFAYTQYGFYGPACIG